MVVPDPNSVTLPSSSSIYGKFLNSFVSDDQMALLNPNDVSETVTPGADTVQYKKVLWANFLYYNGYSTANPPSESDPVAQAQFIRFLKTSLALNSQSQLSPLEIAKRALVGEVLEVSLKTLKILQNTMAEVGNLILFYGALQQEYSKMLQKVPLYLPTPQDDWKPSTNPTQFTFSYDNISVDDISKYVGNFLGKANTAIPGFTADGSIDPNAPNSKFGFTMSNGSDSSAATVTISWVNLINPVATAGGTPYVDTNTNTTYNQYVSLTCGSQTFIQGVPAPTTSTPGEPPSTEQWQKAYNDAFMTLYNAHVQDITNAAGGSNPRLRWQYIDPGPGASNPPTDDEQAAQNAASKSRSEINAKLQQLIANIRGFRTRAQKTAQIYQNTLNSLNSSISSQSDLMSSILDNTLQISRSIFK